MIAFPGKDKIRTCVSRSVCRRARCVFVLSTGRCGTTTLTKILSLSNGVHSVHEPQPWFLSETHRAYQQHPVHTDQGNYWMTAYSLARFRPLLNATTTGTLYAETSNRLTYFAPLLADHFRNAKFIHIYRHPADVVRSAMRRRYYTGEHAWDDFRITPTDRDDWQHRWNSWESFEKCCWYWQAVNRFSVEVLASLSSHRSISIAAEDLFNPNCETAKFVLDFLSLRTPEIEQLRNTVTTPENAQSLGKFPKWEHWPEVQRLTLARIAGDIAERLGYSIGTRGSFNGPSTVVADA